MQHIITTSADGSSTMQLTQFKEAYHSTNGAYTEAMHIYIRNGLEHLFTGILPSPHTSSAEVLPTAAIPHHNSTLLPPHIRIFDIGFGTALNCILSYSWQQQLLQAGLPYPRITYHGIEKYPIPQPETGCLNYCKIIAQNTGFPPDKLSDTFRLIHSSPWETDVDISPDFTLHKSCADIAALSAEYYRNTCPPPEAASGTVIFYDTFSPATQPELWDEAIFRSIASGCTSGSILVTYCCKGTVKQALRNAGFTLERLGGPPGKRHILRGTL